MKIKVNRNILWAKVFIDQLAELGVRQACISPGSRSTPLTYVLSRNRKIKTFVHTDERSSAFFALGLAKASGNPVIVVTTSGTAVAELYPAIIEAYYQRTPLIICTADRPPELIGKGSNQTINQHNIFANHIRWFRDLGLPSISDIGLNHLQKIAIRSYQISLNNDKGPVHLNFPFRKPLEPGSYTDLVNKKIIQINPLRFSTPKSNSAIQDNLIRLMNRISEDVIRFEKGLIIAGPMEYSSKVLDGIKKLSRLLNYPILADGISQLRFGVNKNDKNIIANCNSFLKSDNFKKVIEPDIILQFGRTPTSAALDEFLSKSNADRYLVNSFGDKFDPAGNSKAILPVESELFCEMINAKLKQKKFLRRGSNYLQSFIRAEIICERNKHRFIAKSGIEGEAYLISQIFNLLPSGCNIFIGNSLPVRDLDNFASANSKKINLHFSRGASGIDGINSTALGVAVLKTPTILITGDLSFLHDLSALITLKKYKIKLLIIVINNNGGGIFESLPIANKVKNFKEYFLTPHDLDLGKIVNSFEIDHQLISSLRKWKAALRYWLKKNTQLVIEIKTDARKSADLRVKYFDQVMKKLNKEFAQ
jgi:2-succinyl-5-enolpyruvyl-6-hydroxy-3-cyclohexene-1-carboxylate synthase